MTYFPGVGGGDLVSTNNLSDVANAVTARDHLGVEIGVDVQAYDADLASLSNLPAATAKTIPVNADIVALWDSAAANVVKQLSWSDIKTILQARFDTLYAVITHATTHKNGGSDELLLHEFGEPTASVEFNQQQALQFRLENRTSDPGSPAVGQMWIRTDL